MNGKRWWNLRRATPPDTPAATPPITPAAAQAVDIAAALAEQRVNMTIARGDLARAVREYQTEIASYRNLLDIADQISLSAAMARHLTRYVGRACIRMSVVQTLMNDHFGALASSAEAKTVLDPLLDIDAIAYGEQVVLASYAYAEARLKANMELSEALAATAHAEAVLRTAPLDANRSAQLSKMLQLTFALANELGLPDAAAQAATRLTQLVGPRSSGPR